MEHGIIRNKNWVKMNRYTCNHFYLIIFSFLLFLSADNSLRAAEHFQKPVTSPHVCDFLGNISINGLPANPNDEIAFFDATGLLCGLFIVQHTGQYGFLHVYGDDPATPVDEGAISGEQLSIKVWDSQADVEYQGENIFLVAGDQAGSVLSSHLPPVWHSQVRYALNIYAFMKNDMNLNQKIDLSDAIIGIQLISHQQTCRPPCLFVPDMYNIIQLLQQLSH